MLGIWKAGGAYVSLDPKLPAERVRYMLDNSRMPIVLTQSHLADKLPEGHSAKVVVLDTEWSKIQQSGRASTTKSAPRSGHSNLAYVLYTSGSTGVPKGVMVEQGSVTSLITTITPSIFKFGPGDRTIQNTTFAFDMSVEEIWCTFLAGATLYLKPIDVVCRK